MRQNLSTITKILRRHQTPWELKLWNVLRGNKLGVKFKRQVPIDKYIVDFCCQEFKLIIELDGGHHNETAVSATDSQRQAYLESRGYKILRFWNNDIDRNLGGVIESILNYLNDFPSPKHGEHSSSSLSPGDGEGSSACPVLDTGERPTSTLATSLPTSPHHLGRGERKDEISHW